MRRFDSTAASRDWGCGFCVRALATALALAVTVAMAACGGDGGGKAGSTTTKKTTTTSATTTTKKKNKKLTVGDVLTLEGVKYQVLSAKKSAKLPLDLAAREGVTPGAAADGVYVVVRVKLRGAKRRDFGPPGPPGTEEENRKDIREDFLDGDGVVRYPEGIKFSETTKATEFKFAFDVPKKAVAGSKLRVHVDDSTGTIHLGLS